MTETGKVIDPKTEDLISGDQDLGFLEDQVKKILNTTLRIYTRNQRVGSIIMVITGISYLLLAYAALDNKLKIFPLVIGTSIIFISVIYFIFWNINSKYLQNKEIRNVRDWKKFLESKESTIITAEPQGKLEVLMRMVASIDRWLHAEKSVEGWTIGILASSVLFPVIILFLIGLIFYTINMVFLVIFECGDFGFLSILIAGRYYLNKKYITKQEIWAPRLLTYRARLDSYWRML